MSKSTPNIYKVAMPLYLVALALTVAVPAKAAVSDGTDNWSKIQRDATEALDTNRYWIAEPLLKQAVIEAGKFGYTDMRLAKSLGELGRLYSIRGRFDDAEPFLEEELSVKEETLGKFNDKIIPAMGSLIRFYLLHGTAEKAEPKTTEFLDLINGKLNETVPQTAGKIKFQPGMTLTGRAATAAPVVRDPLLEWAIACDDLANVYKSKGNFDLAGKLYRTALDMKTTILGKEHLSLANSYDSLAELYLAKGQLEDAESYFEEALTFTEKILPPEAPEVYNRLDKLAKCLIKQGKESQAEELYRRAQGLWKTEPSKNGTEARARFALGCIYADRKNYEAAAPILQEAMQLAESFYGPESATLIPYIQKYAYVLYYLGRMPENELLKARVSAISGITM
jgi:tetratricopeptide (TPR) repeat protein